MIEDRSERVRLILGFHTAIVTRLEHVREDMKKAEGRPCAGFGAYDDDEFQKLQLESAQHASQLKATESELLWTWKLVGQVFGENDVALAMCDAWKVIGWMPYVS